jgi:hypothetical protein
MASAHLYLYFAMPVQILAGFFIDKSLPGYNTFLKTIDKLTNMEAVA